MTQMGEQDIGRGGAQEVNESAETGGIEADMCDERGSRRGDGLNTRNDGALL